MINTPRFHRFAPIRTASALAIATLAMAAQATTLPHGKERDSHRDALAALMTCDAPRATVWDQGALMTHVTGSGAQRLVNVPGQTVGTTSTDADYALPEPMMVLGTPVRAFSVMTTQTPDGAIREVSALIDQGVWAALSARAGLTPTPATGLYERQVGANTLLLRSQSGQTALVCQYDSHRWTRSSSRLWRAIKAPFARWAEVNAAPAKPAPLAETKIKLGPTSLPPTFSVATSE